MGNRSDLYTADEIRLLKKLIEVDKLTSKIIGEKLGRTRCSVIGKAKREGIIFPKREPKIKKISNKNYFREKFNNKVSENILKDPFDENPPTARHFLDCNSEHCRWPLLNGLRCGARKTHEISYCPRHQAIAYEPNTKMTMQELVLLVPRKLVLTVFPVV